MSINLLTFELSQKDAGAIFEIERKLSIFDSTIRIGLTAWLVETAFEPAQLLNQIRDYFDSDDNVFVFKLGAEWEAAASFDQHTWIENRLG